MSDADGRLPPEELSLIITAYNEEEALPKLFEEIISDLREWAILEVIIVNDGSRDRTATVIKELIERYDEHRPGFHLKAIHMDENRGMGAALKLGYAASTRAWVTFLPGDGQIEPKMIAHLWTEADSMTSLITTRYTNREYTLGRKVLSRGLRLITALIIWVDITSEGMYLIKGERLRALPLISDSFMLNLEIPIRISELKLSIKVADIEVRERQGGVSHATQWRRIINTFKDLISLKYKLLRERWRS